MLLANSWMVWLIGALGVLLNIMAPFTEEPWLKERFGEEYWPYKTRVPRFIHFRKMGKAA
jgi:protein-S-isoprenylcysteine O-methyltransferase Ste14